MKSRALIRLVGKGGDGGRGLSASYDEAYGS